MSGLTQVAGGANERQTHSTAWSAQRTPLLSPEVGLKERQAYYLDKLNDLIPELQALVSAKTLGTTVGAALAALTPAEQQALDAARGGTVWRSTGHRAAERIYYSGEEACGMRLVLPVVVQPQEDGPGFLAICPTLQGCHAEGDTVGAALDHVQAVAAALLALRREDGLPWPTPDPDAESGRTAMQGQLAIQS